MKVRSHCAPFVRPIVLAALMTLSTAAVADCRCDSNGNNCVCTNTNHDPNYGGAVTGQRLRDTLNTINNGGANVGGVNTGHDYQPKREPRPSSSSDE